MKFHRIDRKEKKMKKKKIPFGWNPEIAEEDGKTHGGEQSWKKSPNKEKHGATLATN